MVHSLQHFAVQKVFQLLEIDDESRGGIDLALYRYLQGIVVPVPIQVGALAEDATVLFLGPLRIMVIMRRRKLALAR